MRHRNLGSGDPTLFSNLRQRLRDLLSNPEYLTDDMKDFDKFHRMNEERKMAFLEVRMEAEAYRAEKEAELAEIAEAMSNMDYADAMAESFGLGLGNSEGQEGEGQGNGEAQ